MAGSCASNISSPLQSNPLLRLRSKNIVIDSVSLHGVAKNTTFPTLRVVTVNRKQSFLAIPMSYKSYGQSRAMGDRIEADGDDECGLILSSEEVMKETEVAGVRLPLDMLDVVKSTGFAKSFLLWYLSMQRRLYLGLLLARWLCCIFWNQMMFDPWYLVQRAIKFASHVLIDLTAANYMKMAGLVPDEIASYFSLRLTQTIIFEGFIESFMYSWTRQDSWEKEGLVWAGYHYGVTYLCATFFFTISMYMRYC